MNSNNNDTMTFVKIAFKDELRRVAFASESGVQGLQETCTKLFALKNFAPYQLTYEDAEGDVLILSSTEELNQLVAGGKTPKLNLVARKVAKPVAIRIVRAPATETSKPEEEKVTPQATEAPEAATESPKEDPKEQESKAPKKSFREKMVFLKEQTVSTKVVRLRWRQANPDSKPQETTEGESERCNWRQKKLASKGSYVGANFKGKIKFTCGVEKKGLWFCRELTNGDRMFSPLCTPFCFLRVSPDGTVNLSQAGIGQKTRWGFAPLTGESNFGGRLVSRATPNLHLTAVSAGKKKKCHSELKKERVEARGLDLAATPKNLLSSEFAIEEVDAVQVLKWMAIRKAWKKRAHHHAKKEQKKQAKQLTKCERRRAFIGEAHAHGHHPHDGAHPHPHAFAHAHARHHWRHHREQAAPGVGQEIPVPLAEPQQQPEQVGAIPQQQAPGPHSRPCFRPRPGMMVFRRPHGPFNV